MARYIDADLLLKDINESVVFSVRNGKNSAELRGAKKILDQIIKHKYTADVVEVVRCKDCKYWGKLTLPENRTDGMCDALTLYHNTIGRTEQDHFCSYGERKDEDNAE